MSELEPGGQSKREVARRHVPHVIVPVAPEDVRDFVRDALRNTSILNPVARVYAGWAFFEPHVRFTTVDASHTRIELDVSSTVPGAETLLFVQRRAEIDRFFVAIEDELDRRERRRPQLPPFDKL